MSMSLTKPKPAAARKPVVSPKPRAAPPRRTQAERSAATKLRVLAAAAAKIRVRGYAQLRTADVAEAAGVSRGAMLHHFPTKNALVVATLEHVFEAARLISRARAEALQPAADLIEAVIEDAREFFFNKHFKVALDIVLSTSTDTELRDQVLAISQAARLPVEAAWAEALVSRGAAAQTAADLVALTTGLVRGMAIRALWQDDAAWFERLFALWRRMAERFLAPELAKPKRRRR
jgi:AcrR family transcriptional regulator